MAQGTREVGRLQDDYDKEVGQQITDFLRFKGLEDAASNVNMRVTGGGRPERTLIGTGTNPGITYSHLREMSQGPAYMSRLARQMVRQNSPIPSPVSDVENGVTVLRGGSDQGKSDIENGVTVFRGGGGMPPSGWETGVPVQSRDTFTPATAGFDQAPDLIPFSQGTDFPLPVNNEDNPVYPPTSGQWTSDMTGPGWFTSGGPNTTPETPDTSQDTSSSDTPSIWQEYQDNQ